MVDGAGRRHDEVRRPVPALEEGAHRPGVHGGDRVVRADDVPAERVVGEERPPEQLLHRVLGAVVGGGELLQDHVPLGPDVLRPQERLRHDVGQQLDAERRGPCRHAQVEDRLLLGGVGVEVATGGVDGHRDPLGVPRRGALEQQVLEEVRDAGLLDRLVPAADADPDPDGDRAGPVDRLGHHPGAVGQRRPPDRGVVPRLGPGLHWTGARPSRARRTAPGRDRPAGPTSTCAPVRSAAARAPSSVAAAAPTALTTIAVGTAAAADAGTGGSELAELLAQLVLEGVLEGDVVAFPRRRHRRRGVASSPSAAGLGPARPPSSPPRGWTGRSEILPCGSMSSTVTSSSSPRDSTSSTALMRRPPPILEMWTRPSRPGRMFTKAPNFVMFTTLPG